MKKLWAWVRTKGRLIFAALAVTAVATAVFAGKMDDAIALAILVMAGEVAGLGWIVKEHTTQVTALLEDVAKTGTSVTVHNYGAAGKSAAQAVADGIKLAQSIEAGEKAGNS